MSTLTDAAGGAAGASIIFTLAGAQEQRKGMLLQSTAARLSGHRRRVEAEFEAKQMEVNAGQVVAASQRDAIEVQRQSDLIESRARAVAASSGGSLTDTTTINQIARLSSMGAYQKAVALYQGEDKARTMRFAAETKRYEGKLAEELGDLTAGAYEKGANAAYLGGWAQAAGMGASMLGKYG